MSNQYQAYAEYKDSGVEWLGKVPEHWEVKKSKHLFRIETGGTPLTSNDENFDKNGIAWVKPDNLNELIPIIFTQKYVSKVGVVGIPIIPKGSILVCGIGTVGKFGIAGTDLITNQQINSFIPNSELIDQAFAKYLIASSSEQLEVTANKVVVAISNKTSMQNILLCIPLKNEQQKIVNFLDHETAKIDTLIEKQQLLIKLLKEKRQAVISHAVTKGLNPNAPMRDSGVEWLGEVPEHWDICLIKYKCLEITDGAHVSPVTEGGDRYFISITDIKKGKINFDDALLTTSESFEYLVKAGCMPFSGDILFSKDGTIGQTAITPGNIEFVVASSLIIIRPNKEKVTPYYLDFLLQSGVVVEQVESFVKGAALRRLSIQNLLKVGGSFPPIAEQKEIFSHLMKTLEQYDDLEERASDLIKLQQERRTALISAAVTGKIDVRNWQAPKSENKAISA